MVVIKHLVISGGGPCLLQTLGVLQYLEEHHFLDRDNIETIYGTSAGAIVGILIALRYDWETIREYIIKRPWHEVFPIKINNIFEAYTKKGIFDEKTVLKCFKPLLSGKDVALDINLKDFYDYSKVELHFFSFDVNSFETYDISYLTHPSLGLMTAIHMSCALPILMTPICLDGKCYIYGGVASNYPLNKFIQSTPEKNINETLWFRNQYNEERDKSIEDCSTLLDFTMSFVFKLIRTLSTERNQPEIPYEIVYKVSHLSVGLFKTTLSSVTTREELYNSGIETAKEFYSRFAVLEDRI